MSSPAAGVLRLTRAGALTSAAVGLSLGAHLAAGGPAPGAVGLGMVALPVLALALLATGRRLGAVAVGGLIGLTQVGLHLAFGALALDPGTGRAGGDHAAHLALLGGGVGGVLGGGVGGVLGGGVGGVLGGGVGGVVGGGVGGGHALTPLAMTLAHLAAAGALAVLLARGEQAVWALWAWLTPSLPDRGAIAGATTPSAAGGDRDPHAGAPRRGPRPRGPPSPVRPTALA